MHFFVGRVFLLHLPAHRRTRRRADEEEPPGVRTFEILDLVAEWSGFPKVAFGDGISHDRGPIENLPYGECSVNVVEGADDAVHGSERGEGVQGCDVGDVLFDGGQRGRVKDFGVIEPGDQECVGWRGGLCEGREGGKIEGEG